MADSGVRTALGAVCLSTVVATGFAGCSLDYDQFQVSDDMGFGNSGVGAAATGGGGAGSGGHGGAAAGAAANGGNGAGGGTGGAAAGGAGGGCAMPPVAPGDLDCPEACSGGCVPMNLCLIECEASGCIGETLDCPPGFDCAVSCVGPDACDEAIIHCPDIYRCSVGCDGGIDACGSVQLHCTDGPCETRCGTGTDTCKDMVVNCSTGACLATCEGTSTPTSLASCSGACECQTC